MHTLSLLQTILYLVTASTSVLAFAEPGQWNYDGLSAEIMARDSNAVYSPAGAIRRRQTLYDNKHDLATRNEYNIKFDDEVALLAREYAELFSLKKRRDSG